MTAGDSFFSCLKGSQPEASPGAPGANPPEPPRPPVAPPDVVAALEAKLSKSEERLEAAISRLSGLEAICGRQAELLSSMETASAAAARNSEMELKALSGGLASCRAAIAAAKAIPGILSPDARLAERLNGLESWVSEELGRRANAGEEAASALSGKAGAARDLALEAIKRADSLEDRLAGLAYFEKRLKDWEERMLKITEFEAKLMELAARLEAADKMADEMRAKLSSLSAGEKHTAEQLGSLSAGMDQFKALFNQLRHEVGVIHHSAH